MGIDDRSSADKPLEDRFARGDRAVLFVCGGVGLLFVTLLAALVFLVIRYGDTVGP
jgi:hypothetical protein